MPEKRKKRILISLLFLVFILALAGVFLSVRRDTAEVRKYCRILLEQPDSPDAPAYLEKITRLSRNPEPFLKKLITRHPEKNLAVQALLKLVDRWETSAAYDRVEEFCGKLISEHPNSGLAGIALAELSAYYRTQEKKENLTDLAGEIIRDYPGTGLEDEARFILQDLRFQEQDVLYRKRDYNKFISSFADEDELFEFYRERFRREGIIAGDTLLFLRLGDELSKQGFFWKAIEFYRRGIKAAGKEPLFPEEVEAEVSRNAGTFADTLRLRDQAKFWRASLLLALRGKNVGQKEGPVLDKSDYVRRFPNADDRIYTYFELIYLPRELIEKEGVSVYREIIQNYPKAEEAVRVYFEFARQALMLGDPGKTRENIAKLQEIAPGAGETVFLEKELEKIRDRRTRHWLGDDTEIPDERERTGLEDRLTAVLKKIKAETAKEQLPELHYQAGKIHHRLGNFSEAEKAFRTVVEQWPESPAAPPSTYNLGYLFWNNLGRKSEALEAFNTLIIRYPAERTAAATAELVIALEETLRE